MRWRGYAKQRWCEWRPGNLKWFRYFGTRVYFPKGDLLFRMACEQGIYEANALRLINHMLVPGSTYLDIGANIGLMSVPSLAAKVDCKVVSIEAAPSILPCLSKTRNESQYGNRWTIIGKAIGAAAGEATLYEGSSTESALGGLRDTGRGEPKRPVSVQVTTIDGLWRELRKPYVSVIKLDIEGGELMALQGAVECLTTARPAILIEWTKLNFAAYGHSNDALLSVAEQYCYDVFSVPGYAAVRSPTELELQMLETETFALIAQSNGPNCCS